MRRQGAGCAVALGAEVRVVPSCEGISEGIVLTSEKFVDEETDLLALCRGDSPPTTTIHGAARGLGRRR